MSSIFPIIVFNQIHDLNIIELFVVIDCIKVMIK